MGYIRVDQAIPVFDGQPVTFKSPASCKGIEGLKVYYPVGKGTEVATFALADAHGNNVGSIDLFAANVLVKVILDTDQGMAYVQNADTNAYLEGRFEELKGGAVSKSGDTMTGNLTVSRATPHFFAVDTDNNTQAALWQNSNQTVLSNRNVAGEIANQRSVVINNSAYKEDIKDALMLYDTTSGTSTWLRILHEGNTNRSKLVADDSLPEMDGEIYWRYK